MKTIRFLVPLLFITIIINTQVKAASINFIDHGDYTTDLTSGLDWLDVTKSVNQSYSYISSQLIKEGEYDGWRYANGAEFNKLVSTYTGKNLGSDVVYSQFPVGSLNGLMDLLGRTSPFEDDSTMGLLWGAEVSLIGLGGSYHTLYQRYEFRWPLDVGFSYMGSYLVRKSISSEHGVTTIPAPPILLLLIVGFFGIFTIPHMNLHRTNRLWYQK